MLPGAATLAELTEALRCANRELWTVEDELRACERTQRFDARFIELARRFRIPSVAPGKNQAVLDAMELTMLLASPGFSTEN